MGENKKEMVIDMAENSDMKTDALQQVRNTIPEN